MLFSPRQTVWVQQARIQIDLKVPRFFHDDILNLLNPPRPTPTRETSKAVQGKRELWAVVQANARHARDVANAVDARDLQEVKRIVDRARLTRHDFLSVCERLGFRHKNEVAEVMGDGSFDDQIDAEAKKARARLKPANSTATGSAGTEPAAEAPGEAEACAESKPAAAAGDAALELGEIPVFFLDAEGKGGTTALALATIDNNVETVRRLVKEVRYDTCVLVRVPVGLNQETESSSHGVSRARRGSPPSFFF